MYVYKRHVTLFEIAKEKKINCFKGCHSCNFGAAVMHDCFMRVFYLYISKNVIFQRSRLPKQCR